MTFSLGGSGGSGSGKDGRDGIDGKDGRDGIDGKDGLSAYEIALKNGFIGTEQDWLESLIGGGSGGRSTSIPVGSTFATLWTDDVVSINGEIYLKCNGQEFDPLEYPALAEVRPIQDVDIAPEMTSNTTPVPFEASASSIFNSTYAAYKAFNRANSPVESDSWVSANNSFNTSTGIGHEWLQIKLDHSRSISKYAIKSRSTTDNNVTGYPRDFTLQGSNDGITWDIVDIRTDETVVGAGVTITYTLPQESSYYQYYRLDITKVSFYIYTDIGQFYLYTIKHILPNLSPNSAGMYYYIKASTSTDKQQLIETLDAEYEPQFTSLVEALGRAQLSDNQGLISEIHNEYAELKENYQKEREEILNDD